MFSLRNLLSLLAALVLAAQAVPAQAIPSQTRTISIREIQPGQRGVGRTIFVGNKIEEFQVEVLGVLENIGPRQNIILARLSGGPLDKTGVIAGMSGSPVWIDGRLAGAVALAFPFSKEPIAGIRPIEEMLAAGTATRPAVRAEAKFGEARLAEVATPVSFSGFTARAVEQFAPEWRKLGMTPLQGISGQGAASRAPAKNSPLEPGSMISVQLVSGDMQVGADGTVTTIDKDQVYAFGHRFLALGSAELPFSRSEVITVLPSLDVSFKISSSKEPLGTIRTDGNAAIVGTLGRRPATIPVKLTVQGTAGLQTFRMEMIRTPALVPFLLQMVLFSAIDGSERTLGSSTISITGELKLEGGLPPLKIKQAYAGDFNTPVLAAMSTAAPIANLLQGSSETLRVSEINLAVNSTEVRAQWQIDQVSTSRREVRPGETIELAVALSNDGNERVERLKYLVPAGASPGPLTIAVSDGTTANLAEARSMLSLSPRPATQMLTQLNSLRTNGSAWVRISRPDPVYSMGGTELPNIPAGLAMLAARSTTQSLLTPQGTRVAEFEIPLGTAVVSGQKSVQIEVKE
ncbi:MAG: hypothetical protein NTZ56_03220 [Acidobacteria bacterium]|nr:hypothetical protein [Acidobacteriota bacterium]